MAPTTSPEIALLPAPGAVRREERQLALQRLVKTISPSSLLIPAAPRGCLPRALTSMRISSEPRAGETSISGRIGGLLMKPPFQ
jgi:hypothetical protein